jgi:hypothetical protein
MKIKNKDIILTNENGQHQRISFRAGVDQEAHIWYDDLNDEIIIEGAIRVDDINSNSPTISLHHDKLSSMNSGQFVHLNQQEYNNFIMLTDGSLITDFHWHETVNGHKITVNTGLLPASSNAFDIHITVE